MLDADALLEELSLEIGALKNAIQDALGAALQPETVDNVVELALLRSFAVLEHFVEELFYLCMLNDSSVAGSGAVVVVGNREQVDLLLRSTTERTLPFLSWLPAYRFLDAASRYLGAGHPFDRVRYRDTELASIIELTTVRNAVAHPDSSAMAKFRELAESRGYSHGRAARYLLSMRSGVPEILLLMTRVELLARALVARDDAAAEAFLEPERPFTAGQRAPVGLYVCKRCAAERTHLEVGPLGSCIECEDLTPCPACGRAPKAAAWWQRRVAPLLT